MRLKPGDCFIAQDVVILSYSELLLAGIVDITERHMAQQSHAHSQQRLEQLLRAKTLLAQLLQSGPSGGRSGRSPHVSAKATEILQLVDKKLQQRDTGISWSASGFLNVQAQIRPNGTDSTPYRLLQDDRSAALAHLVEVGGDPPGDVGDVPPPEAEISNHPRDQSKTSY